MYREASISSIYLILSISHSAYGQQRANMFSRLAAVDVLNPNLKILLGLSNNRRNLEIIRILLAYIYETERHNQL